MKTTESIACRPATIGPLAALALTGLISSGCNVVAPVAYAIEGAPKQEALYTLPSAKIVVFIDDRAGVIPRTRLRQAMANRATNELLQVQRLVPSAVDPNLANRVALEPTDGKPLPIDEVGRRVGADIVVYAVPERFAVTEDSMPHPTASLRVKVIDCRTGKRLWPDDPTGAPMVAQMAMKPATRYETDEIDKLYESLADFTGLRLAQVFFEHERNPMDAQLSR